MTKQLFIPDKIKVGFQNRQDTYTKKLAYVIYFDQKGVLRKEKSWEGWRDKKIDAVEFTNEPTSGFVLNKGVGGQRQSYGWNARNEYIRVYDPRDFEFEISVSNLLFILRECDCSKGKGLEGKFAYAWDGTELVLLPEISTDYQTSKAFTDLQVTHVNPKELIPGASYLTKKQQVWTYLGRFDYHTPVEKKLQATKIVRKHVFWNGKSFEYPSGPRVLAKLQSDVVTPDYANLVDKFNKSENGSAVKSLFLKDLPEQPTNDHYYSYRNYWAVEDTDGTYLQCYSHTSNHNRSDVEYVSSQKRVFIHNGILVSEDYRTDRWKSPESYNAYHRRYYYGRNQTSYPMSWIEPTNKALYAKLESGSEFKVDPHYGTLVKGTD
jgi:hypothetical protein